MKNNTILALVLLLGAFICSVSIFLEILGLTFIFSNAGMVSVVLFGALILGMAGGYLLPKKRGQYKFTDIRSGKPFTIDKVLTKDGSGISAIVYFKDKEKYTVYFPIFSLQHLFGKELNNDMRYIRVGNDILAFNVC